MHYRVRRRWISRHYFPVPYVGIPTPETSVETGFDVSHPFENIFPERTFVGGHGLEDAVQGADAERHVRRNHDPMVAGSFGLEDDVAADLMDERISPCPAEVVSEARAG